MKCTAIFSKLIYSNFKTDKRLNFHVKLQVVYNQWSRPFDYTVKFFNKALISEVYPLISLVSGGINITVSGSNLNMIQNPVLVVYTDRYIKSVSFCFTYRFSFESIYLLFGLIKLIICMLLHSFEYKNR